METTMIDSYFCNLFINLLCKSSYLKICSNVFNTNEILKLFKHITVNFVLYHNK